MSVAHDSPNEAEQALVRGLAAGDPYCQSVFVRQLLRRLPLVLRRLGDNDEDIQEILSDVALKAITRIDTFNFKKCKSFWNWITQIAKNCSRDRRRSRSAMKTVNFVLMDDLDSNNLMDALTAVAPTLCSEFDEVAVAPVSPKIEALRSALSTLKDKERVIVESHFIENLSDDEIAAKIGTAPNNMREYRRRAVTALKKALAAHPEFADLLKSGECPGAAIATSEPKHV